MEKGRKAKMENELELGFFLVSKKENVKKKKEIELQEYIRSGVVEKPHTTHHTFTHTFLFLSPITNMNMNM